MSNTSMDQTLRLCQENLILVRSSIENNRIKNCTKEMKERELPHESQYAAKSENVAIDTEQSKYVNLN